MTLCMLSCNYNTICTLNSTYKDILYHTMFIDIWHMKINISKQQTSIVKCLTRSFQLCNLPQYNLTWNLSDNTKQFNLHRHPGKAIIIFVGTCKTTLSTFKKIYIFNTDDLKFRPPSCQLLTVFVWYIYAHSSERFMSTLLIYALKALENAIWLWSPECKL